jgi:hypothetical protein
MVIQGYLHDIQPRQVRPTLELYFDAKHRSLLARGERVPIVLELAGTWYGGTMNSANVNNPPYVHTNLTLGDGTRRSCTEVFLILGLAEKAHLEFELTSANDLRLTRTIDKGRWRSGNAPHERVAGTSASNACFRKASLQRVSSKTGTSFPFNDRDEILRLADLYWNLISDGEAAEERAFEEEMQAARKSGFLTKSLFVRLGRWKSVRQTPNYEANDEANVCAATARAFAATDSRTALSALMRLHGVALRTASALLHWMIPDRYPVLDFRVVGALGRPEPSSYEDVGFYLNIAAEIKLLAQRHELDLRTMDRALWAWQKLQSR